MVITVSPVELGKVLGLGSDNELNTRLAVRVEEARAIMADVFEWKWAAAPARVHVSYELSELIGLSA